MNRTLRSLFLLLFIFTSGAAIAQSTGISGTLTDLKGQPLITASVTVTQGGINIGGTVTDYDGKYEVKPLTAGRYTVQFSYQGSIAQIPDVIVSTDELTTVNYKLNTSVSLKEHVVHAPSYVKPLIDPKNPAHAVYGVEKVEHNPGHNLVDIVGQSAQVHQSTSGGAVSLGGGRTTTGTQTVIDGVVLPSTGNTFTNPTFGSVEQASVYVSGIPAKYGDVSGGVITITSKAPTRYHQGGLFLEHSIDGYNHNEASLNLSGPVLTRKDSTGNKIPILGYAVGFDGLYDQDNNPSYYRPFVLDKDKLAQLQQHPLTLIPNTSGAPTLGYAAETVTDADITTQKKRPNASTSRGNATGRLVYSLNQNVNVTLGGSFFATDYANFSRGEELFNPDNTLRTSSVTGRGYVRFTQKFGRLGEAPKEDAITNAFYTVQADYQHDYSTTQDKNLKHNTFDYGYVGKFTENYTPLYRPGTDTVTKVYGVQLQGYQETSVDFTPSTINSGLAAYTSDYYRLAGTPTSQDQIVNGRGLRNGDQPNQVYNLWSAVGSTPTFWSQYNNDQIALSVDASFDIKHKAMTHSIEFGLYYQQRDLRYYDIGSTNSGADLWTQMRLLTNAAVNQTLDLGNPYFIKNGVTYTAADFANHKINPSPSDTIFYNRAFNAGKEGKFDSMLRVALHKPAHGSDYIQTDAQDPSLYSLSMFSADELLNNGQQFATYYGYDYTGKLQTGNVNFNDFFTAKDKNGYYTRPIGAYRPNYLAGYISDYIQYKQLNVTLGVRIERFDNNTKVLDDPYSLYPTYKVSDLSRLGVNSAPAGIGSNDVVYVADNSSKVPTIVGYRNGDTWYDANGREVSDPTTLTQTQGSSSGGKVQPYLQKTAGNQLPYLITSDSFNASNSFRDYKPAVNVMPRINFSFPVNDNALFYAHYDVLVSRPNSTSSYSPQSYATPANYMFLTQNSNAIIGNPDLQPEKTIKYEIGFQQRLTDYSGLSLSGFYTERKNQIQVRPYFDAYPITYYTYGNRDFSTYKGFSLSYDLRRIHHISASANYTLSFAEGTGSNSESANGGSGAFVSAGGLLQNFIAAGEYKLLYPYALDYDSRHSINATVDYRYKQGEGPMISDKHVFENAGIQFVFRARSGEPYTEYATARTLVAGVQNSNLINGAVQGSRLPWHYGLDFNIDKDFKLNFHKSAQKTDGSDAAQDSRHHGLYLNAYLYVQNLFNIKDVIQVYGYTGSASDDGYLSSPQGQTYLPTVTNQKSFSDLYSSKELDPGYLNNPRRMVIGIKLSF